MYVTSSKLRKNEEGAVMVLVAILMTILLMFAALAVDLGLAFYKRQQLQTACDAAALAAVTELPNEAKAKNRAYEYMVENGFSGSPSDVDVQFEGVPASKVRVTSTYVVNSVFAKIFSRDNLNVTCKAAAGKIAKTKSTKFPYLIFAEGGKLSMGADYEIDGAVHTNADLVTNPGDRNPGSYMKQMSYGTEYKIEGHPCVQIDGEDFWIMTIGGGNNKFYFNSQTSDNIGNTYAINTKSAEGQSLETVQGWVSAGQLNTNGDPIKCYPMSSLVEKDDDIILDRDFPTISTKVQATIDHLKSTSYSTSGPSLLKKVKDETSEWTVSTNTNKINSSDSDKLIIKSGSVSAWLSPANGNHTADYAIKSTGSNNVAEIKGTNGNLIFKDLYFYAGSSSSGYSGFTYTDKLTIKTNNIYCNSKLAIIGNTDGYITINGNVYCDGDLDLKNVTINGNVYATGNIQAEHIVVNGLLSCKKNIKIQGLASKFKCTEENGRVAIYSEQGNIEYICQDNPPSSLIGIMCAKEGNIKLLATMEFYGNIIGKTVDASYKEIKGHPITDLAEFDESGVPEGVAGATQYDYVLVE